YTRQAGDPTWHQVSTVDPCDWEFDYPTGVLTLNGTSTAYGAIDSATEFAVTGYRYVGPIGGGTLTSIGGTGGVKTDQIGGAAIVSGAGNLQLDLAYNPTWTGRHIHSYSPATTTPGSTDFAV